MQLRTLETSAENKRSAEMVSIYDSGPWVGQQSMGSSVRKRMFGCIFGWCDNKSHPFLMHRLTKWSRQNIWFKLGTNHLEILELPLNKEHPELSCFLKCRCAEELPHARSCVPGLERALGFLDCNQMSPQCLRETVPGIQSPHWPHVQPRLSL